MTMRDVWNEINDDVSNVGIGQINDIVVSSNEIAKDINQFLLEYVKAGHSFNGKHIVIEKTPFEEIDFSKDVVTATISWRIEENGE